MRVLFSGRFDGLHAGHWTTILRLWREFSSVLVVVLDFPGRDEPAEYVCQIINDMAKLMGADLEIKAISNKTHFGKLTLAEWKEYGCDVYAAGNMDVLNHISGLGIPIHYEDRAWDFAAHNYKRNPPPDFVLTPGYIRPGPIIHNKSKFFIGKSALKKWKKGVKL